MSIDIGYILVFLGGFVTHWAYLNFNQIAIASWCLDKIVLIKDKLKIKDYSAVEFDPVLPYKFLSMTPICNTTGTGDWRLGKQIFSPKEGHHITVEYQYGETIHYYTINEKTIFPIYSLSDIDSSPSLFIDEIYLYDPVLNKKINDPIVDKIKNDCAGPKGNFYIDHREQLSMLSVYKYKKQLCQEFNGYQLVFTDMFMNCYRLNITD